MTREELERIADDAARKYGLDPHIFKAMINYESGWQPSAHGSSGEVGLGQFMPGTWTGVVQRYPELRSQYGADPHPTGRYNPVASLYASAAYLREKVDDAKGSYLYGLAGYNSGNAINPPTVSLVYATKVLRAAGKALDTVLGGGGGGNVPANIINTITSGAGNIIGGAGNIIDPFVSPIRDTTSAIVAVGKWITEPSHWWRIFFLGAGGTLVIIGVVMYRGNIGPVTVTLGNIRPVTKGTPTVDTAETSGGNNGDVAPDTTEANGGNNGD